MTITLGGLLSATDTDILNGTRLQTAPRGGRLYVEFQSSANDASNYAELTVQLPGGDTPFENLRVPADAGGSTGVLNDLDKLSANFPVPQGGHVTLSVTETGSCLVSYRVTFVPGR